MRFCKIECNVGISQEKEINGTRSRKKKKKERKLIARRSKKIAENQEWSYVVISQKRYLPPKIHLSVLNLLVRIPCYRYTWPTLFLFSPCDVSKVALVKKGDELKRLRFEATSRPKQMQYRQTDIDRQKGREKMAERKSNRQWATEKECVLPEAHYVGRQCLVVIYRGGVECGSGKEAELPVLGDTGSHCHTVTVGTTHSVVVGRW